MKLLTMVKPSCPRIALVSLAFLLVAAECGVAQNLSDFSGLQKHLNKDVTVETQDGQVQGKLLRVLCSLSSRMRLKFRRLRIRPPCVKVCPPMLCCWPAQVTFKR